MATTIMVWWEVVSSRAGELDLIEPMVAGKNNSWVWSQEDSEAVSNKLNNGGTGFLAGAFSVHLRAVAWEFRIHSVCD